MSADHPNLRVDVADGLIGAVRRKAFVDDNLVGKRQMVPGIGTTWKS